MRRPSRPIRTAFDRTEVPPQEVGSGICDAIFFYKSQSNQIKSNHNQIKSFETCTRSRCPIKRNPNRKPPGISIQYRQGGGYSTGPLPERGPCLTRNERLLSILHFGIWNPSNGPPRLRRIFDQIRPNSQFPLVRFHTRARLFQELGGFGPFSTLFPSFRKDRTPDKKQTGGATSLTVLPFFKNPSLQQEIHT